MIGNAKLIVPIIWLTAVAGSMAGLVRYQMTPGPAARSIPAHWPAAARLLRRPNHLTLVLFLHPQCPCSRATLNELSIIMSRAAGSLDAHVLLVAPHSAPRDFAAGELMRRAAAINGVSIGIDAEAHDAHAFAAATSGDVRLFAPDGALLFRGGITDGRGHEGDNDGLDAVLAIVLGRQPAVRQTAVFGCPLED